MKRALAPLSMLPRIVGIVFTAGLGLFWLWMAFEVKGTGVAREVDWFGPMFFAVLALSAALFGVIRLLMTMRAPVPRSERAAEGSETVTFDADAAIERYLAQKRSAAADPLAIEPVANPARQVFGRKHTDAA